jgi:hypothetical protein
VKDEQGKILRRKILLEGHLTLDTGLKVRRNPLSNQDGTQAMARATAASTGGSAGMTMLVKIMTKSPLGVPSVIVPGAEGEHLARHGAELPRKVAKKNDEDEVFAFHERSLDDAASF